MNLQSIKDYFKLTEKPLRIAVVVIAFLIVAVLLINANYNNFDAVYERIDLPASFRQTDKKVTGCTTATEDCTAYVTYTYEISGGLNNRAAIAQLKETLESGGYAETTVDADESTGTTLTAKNDRLLIVASTYNASDSKQTEDPHKLTVRVYEPKNQ